MKHFKYFDNKKTPPELIFECDAKNILEADKLYISAIGKEPIKQAYVGCQISEICTEK